MTRLQFWRFLLDCNLHGYGVTLVEYDRMIGRNDSIWNLILIPWLFLAECLPTEKIHGPDESILVREFLNAIAIISYHLHRLKRMFVIRYFHLLKILLPFLLSVKSHLLQLNNRLAFKLLQPWKVSSKIISHNRREMFEVRIGFDKQSQLSNWIGNIFTDSEKYQQASKYKDYCHKIYLLFCTKNKVWFQKSI
jgi:hypothetical protein